MDKGFRLACELSSTVAFSQAGVDDTVNLPTSQRFTSVDPPTQSDLVAGDSLDHGLHIA